MAKLVAIASAKGGVGKTTLLLNLGTALTLFGRSTLVVDGNIEAPALSLHLGVGHISPTLLEVVTGDAPLSEAVFQHQSGLKVVAAKLPSSQEQPEWRELAKGLKQHADIVLLDCANNIDDSLAEAIDAAILVTTPDLPAVSATLVTARKLRQAKTKILGVVLNRVHNDNAEMHPYDVKQMLEAPLLGVIPEDANVRKSLRIGHPVLHTHPDTPASTHFKKIAAHMLGQSYQTDLAPKKEPWYKWFI